MSKQTFYSDGGEDLCYELDHWENQLAEQESDIDYIELEEMKYDKQKHAERWCKLHQEFLDGGECSKLECEDYIPANGARGKCYYKTYTLVGTGVKYRLYRDRLERIEEN